MFNPFKAMGQLGFTRVPEAAAIFAPEPKERLSREKGNENEAVNPENFIFLKNRECPVCSKHFQDAALRVTKCKYTHGDTDLRPYYEPFDPLYYDVVICYHCGYAALHSHFDQLTDRQIGLIRESITSQYKYKEYPLVYRAEDALERYQLALLCALAKKAKDSEKAWLCLKLGWLARQLEDAEAEKGYLEFAAEGFGKAFEKERLPVYGMDDVTLMYLLGELSRRIGKRDEAMRYIGKVIMSHSASARLKDRARQVKDLLLTT